MATRRVRRRRRTCRCPNPRTTHQSLLARIPSGNGARPPAHGWAVWINGPELLRFDERVDWLRDEHSLPHGYARAIVHEHDKRRAAIRS